MSDSLQALFRPDRIAVIGASAKPGKLGFTIFKNILDAGFGGEVIPVNPRGETILGLPLVESISEIPSGTDLAVVIIPAPSVPGAILELGERKVRAAVVITGGFAESGPDGARLQEEVRQNAARCGIRVVGPNCQGVNYPHHGLCASWPLITRLGAMAIASQSETVGAALIDWATEEKLGFSAFVSMGNRIDVDEADLIGFFASDPNTKVITLYIEGVKEAPKFLAWTGRSSSGGAPDGGRPRERLQHRRSKEEQTGFSRRKPGTDRVVRPATGRTTKAGGARKECSPLLRVEQCLARRQGRAGVEARTALTRGRAGAERRLERGGGAWREGQLFIEPHSSDSICEKPTKRRRLTSPRTWATASCTRGNMARGPVWKSSGASSTSKN
jgi:succinyl-CoA synthetase alpha subunit